MANYDGYTMQCADAGDKTTTHAAAMELAILNTFDRRNACMGYTSKTLFGTKVTKHFGYTPTSPVYVNTVLTIQGPRKLPLEISWKKAAVET